MFKLLNDLDLYVLNFSRYMTIWKQKIDLKINVCRKERVKLKKQDK